MLESAAPSAPSRLQSALAGVGKPPPVQPAPVATSAPQLRDYQEDFVMKVRVAYRNGHKAVLLVAATGAGKCLARGTPVMMFDGTTKPAEDVAEGDLLMGPDSRPRRVESLARGREMMYRVTPTKGDAYTVNESHILSLKITGMGDKRITAPDGAMLRSGDVHNVTVLDYLRGSETYKHCAKGWRVAVDFKGLIGPAPLPPYILGVWLGDGRTSNLFITTGDPEIEAEFRQYAADVGMSVRSEPNSAKSVNLHLKSSGSRYGRAGSPFGNALRALGVFHEKRIPHRYKTASREDRLQLLAGILDTDGHLSGNGGFDLVLKSEPLLDDVMFVARSLGFSCYKSRAQKTCCNNGAVGTYWRCHINGAVSEIPCRLPRKQASKRAKIKNVLLTGITVDPVGVDDYYGFEISGPDRLFLLGDFTVTHNTVVFSYIARGAAQKGNRVLILAHRDQLIKQASKKLTENGVVHGIIMAGFTPQPRRGVQVASVQTLVRRLKAMKEAEAKAAEAARASALAAGKTEAEADAAAKASAKSLGFDIIVIDEAHLSAAKSYMDILAAWPDALVLGVTGSPIRLDGKGLGRTVGGAFDTIVQGITIRELISRAFLVKPKVFASKMQVDLSGVKKIGGDYDAEAMAAIMDKPVITGHAVTEYKRICPGVPAVAWCTNVAHARHVAEEFNAAGVPALALSGENTSEERDAALRGLTNGTLKVVTFAMLLVEGVDCPAIGAVIMLRLTMSLSSYLQTIGRGLRPIYAPGMPLDTIEQRFAAIDAGPKGRYCYVIDHVGLWQKHGFADADREWDLLGEQKKKKKKKDEEEKVDLCQCPKCWHVFDPKDAEEQALGRRLFTQANNGMPAPEGGIFCTSCGHMIPARVRKGPEHVDGELAEITPEMEAALKQKNKAEVRGAKTLEELERIAAQRGYSPNWARHAFEAKKRARERYTGGR